MIVGRKYKVDLEDCCVQAHFTATLVRADLTENWWDLEWDNGVTTGSFPGGNDGRTYKEVVSE